jgi:glutamate carboxypeptidase
VRFRTPEQARRLERELDALSTPGEGLPRVRVRRSLTRPAKPLTDSTRALAALVRRAGEDLGADLPWGSTGGVCDGNNLQAQGLPTLDTLGVRGGGLHTPGEWIELPSLVERCRLIALVLYRLATGGVPAPLPDPTRQDPR